MPPGLWRKELCHGASTLYEKSLHDVKRTHRSAPENGQHRMKLVLESQVFLVMEQSFQNNSDCQIEEELPFVEECVCVCMCFCICVLTIN